MKQIFILGASSVYGVGAERAGWGDMVKSYVHSKMYGPGGAGETCEVFNFSKAGSTVEFVAYAVPWIYQNYARDGDLLTLISVGGNDAKAQNAADNFVSTPEDFKEKVAKLMDALKQHSKNVAFVSNRYVDEAKVNPKPSPFGDGDVSYFTNERRFMFNDITKQLCKNKGFDFVTPGPGKDEWIKNYLYTDGLHPNQAGYQKTFEALRPIVDSYLAT